MTKRQPSKKQPTTFVFVGNNNASGTYLDAVFYDARSDCYVVRPEGHSITESIEKTTTETTIAGNIIGSFHGSPDGTFEWNAEDGKGTPYNDFFCALPRQGIKSVTLTSCFGGTAENVLETLPPGCLLFTIASDTNVGDASQSAQFAEETEGLTKPIDIFLEILDNFDPESYRHGRESENNKRRIKNEALLDSDPNHAIPHIIGIGGPVPVTLDLNEETRRLITQKNPHHVHDATWQRTIERVKSRFDEVGWKFDPKDPRYILFHDSDPAQKTISDKQVAAIAQRMMDGDTTVPATIEEKRIAFALTAAYLDESGKLGILVAQAKAPHPGPEMITKRERHYMENVAEQLRLKGDSQLDDTIEKMVDVFSQSKKTDYLEQNSPLVQHLTALHISTKHWTR